MSVPSISKSNLQTQYYYHLSKILEIKKSSIWRYDESEYPKKDFLSNIDYPNFKLIHSYEKPYHILRRGSHDRFFISRTSADNKVFDNRWVIAF